MDEMHSITSAVPGWRIAYLRKSPPWVQEELPVVVWALADDPQYEGRQVIPLVLTGGCVLLPPDPRRVQVLLGPGESTDRAVEEAKENVRMQAQATRYAAKARKERAAKRAAAAADPDRVRPPREDRRIAGLRKAATDKLRWSNDDGSSLDLVAFVIGRGCELAEGAEADADSLFRLYESWCAAWKVRPLARVTFTTVVSRKFAGVRRGGSYTAWKGLRLKDGAVPRVSTGDDERDRASLRAFVGCHLRISLEGHRVDEKDAWAWYCHWCRWKEAIPVGRSAFVDALDRRAFHPAKRGPDGTRTWNALRLRFPGTR
jgi:hypothetical protein